MNDDLISRQAAIEALGERPLIWEEYTDEYELGQRSQYDSDRAAIETVSSALRWIHVMERLPKESDGKVLILVGGEVEIGRYSEFSKTWYIGDMNGVGGDDPIAWMPLPEPYKEME